MVCQLYLDMANKKIYLPVQEDVNHPSVLVV